MPRVNRRRVGPLLVAPDGRTPLTAVMWRCSKCREAKPEADFTVTDGATGRRRAACKACESPRLAVRTIRDRRDSGAVSVRVQGTARLRFAADGLDSLSIAQLVGGA